MMPRILIRFIFLLALSSSASAYMVNRGFYIGGQFGYAYKSLSKIPVSDVVPDTFTVVGAAPGTSFTSSGIPLVITSATITSFIGPQNFDTDVNDNVIAGRIYLGYRILEQLALELGYFRVRDQTTSYITNPFVSVTGMASSAGVPFAYSADFNALTRKDTYKEQAWDLNIKAILPLRDCFDLYARLGVAYLTITQQTQIILENSSNVVVAGLPGPASPISITTAFSSKTRNVYPTLGIGVSYNFSEGLSFDASWYRIASKNNDIGKIDFLSIGFSYQFSDLLGDFWSEYCCGWYW